MATPPLRELIEQSARQLLDTVRGFGRADDVLERLDYGLPAQLWMSLFYRIIRDKQRHTPLSIEGSRLFGGGWSPKGVGVLQATSTPEPGLVETLAHAPSVRYEDFPTYWVFSGAVPDDIRYVSRDELPVQWQEATYERTQGNRLIPI